MQFPHPSLYGEPLPFYMGEPSIELEKRIEALAFESAHVSRVLDLARSTGMTPYDRMVLLAYTFVGLHQRVMKQLEAEFMLRQPAPIIESDGKLYVFDSVRALERMSQGSHTRVPSSPTAPDDRSRLPGSQDSPTALTTA